MTPISLSEWLSSLVPAIILLLLWLIPVLIALLHLQKYVSDQTAKAIWVLIILMMPILGSVTYLLMGTKHGQNTDK